MKKLPHPIVRLLKLLFFIALLPLLYVAGVIGYAYMTDYQPAPQEEAPGGGTPIDNDWASDTTIQLLNWNIGYAGLGANSDFWKDGGSMVHSTQPQVASYLSGIAKTVAAYADTADFILLQEVDRNSARSYHIDQMSMIADELPGYAWSFGKNYDVHYIPVPLLEPYGGVLSGLVTYSKSTPTVSVRHNFEGNYSFPTGLFYLDRCFLLNRFPLKNGKELVVINTHNSAYDDGSLKKRQMTQMAEVLEAEYAQGHYVIVGGDWNQVPANYPGWRTFIPPSGSAVEVPEVYPSTGWSWAYDLEVPTNRALRSVFDADTSFQKVIDFYLLSPNLAIEEVRNIDLGFAYSDHQPVWLSVKLLSDSSAQAVVQP